jgi:phosphoribosylaminoimidazolecarboxamide formyltransferase/IMP cyclohydrolase
VSDKTGLVDFAKALADRGVELLSTGGTARRCAMRADRDGRGRCDGVSRDDGRRVKTLHPKVHGGLLALRDNPSMSRRWRTHGIGAIDLLVVNLYPFEETVAGGRITPRRSRISTSAAPR